MKRRLVAGALLVAGATSSCAHRLDEYLQAALFSVEKDRVGVQLRLTPGVAVFPVVLASIDLDGDGRISGAEQNTYAQTVLRDLSLTLDGDPLPLNLDSVQFARLEDMKTGTGEIQLEIHADLTRGGPKRKLVFNNRHQSRIAAFLVNSLVPRDPAIRLTGQTRNVNQSEYQLDYVQSGASSGWRSGEYLFAAAVVLLLLTRLAWLNRRGLIGPQAPIRS